ncbi:hypothetical protein KAH94_02545, partial [bacterium]|nr:hypothetical protein [bacterium]
MKKRVVALVFLGLLFAGFIGLRKSLDAVETQSKTAKFFNKILTRVVKDVEAIEKGVRKVITEIGYAISLPFRENIKKLQIPIAQNPYATTKAFVRKGGVQSPQEVEYLKLRRPIARRALEAFLGKTFPPHVILPDVMVSLSGGGNRASILSWGFLRALEKIGLLDCTTHVTSLSGSTWMLLPWLVSGLPLEQFKQLLFNSVIHGPKFRTPENIKHAMDFLLRKVAFKRSTTLIDLYGIGLGTILFHGLGENRDPLQVYMNSLQDPLNTALIPYPIITSISVPDVRWFTATPHEFGSASLGYYVPIWAFDRDFNNGSSVDMKLYPDRVSVSSLLAMSSAAIGISFGDFYAHTAASIKDKLLKKILSAILEKSPLERIRLLYYEKKNYLRGITGLPVYDTLSGKTWGDVSSI